MQENINNTQPTPEGMVVDSSPSRVSSFAGLFEVFYKPSDFFARLKNDPKVVVPYLVILILSLISAFMIVDIILDLSMKSPEMVERFQGEPPPQVRQIIKYNILGGIPIVNLVIPLLAALLAMFWGNFVFAGQARFKQLLSVNLYGHMIYIVGALLGSVLIMAKGQFMAPFSLGGFVIDQGLQSVAFVALSKIDIFHIWSIIVLGLGLAKLYNFSSNKGILLAVLSSGLLSIIHVLYVVVVSLL